MSTVIGVFSDISTAEKAVKQLRNKGFQDNEISIVAKDERTRGGSSDMEAGGDFGTDSIAEGTTWGGALGGVAGLLAGVGALAIPGIGPMCGGRPLGWSSLWSGDRRSSRRLTRLGYSRRQRPSI